MTYLFIFFQSNLLEWPIYLLRLKQQPAFHFASWAKTAGFVTVLNSVTHPLVFFGFMNLPLPYLANIILAETFAIGTEAFLLRRFAKLTWLSALITSLMANLLSWQIAPMLTYAFFQD